MDIKLRNMTGVYLFKNDKVLLLYRQGSRVVNDLWIGSAGGHFENDELNDPRACALRELREELELAPSDIDELKMRYITLRWTNGEIRQNYYFFGKINDAHNGELSSDEGISRWFGVDEVHELEMPFTAKYVVEHYLKTGKFDDKIYVGVTNSDGVDFTELKEC
ncbi:MAG: NUDIX domain-containing protein [Ruminococcus sp.]|nr:NUDIX domain-containing protein [Ruminococcus sp.]